MGGIAIDGKQKGEILMLRKYDKLFAGGFFLLVAIVMFSQISQIRLLAIAMDSRLLPKVIGILLCTISTFLIIRGLLELKTTRQMPAPRFNKRVVVQIVLSTVLLAVFAFFLPVVGFIIGGIVYLAGSFFLFAPKEKWNIPVFLVLAITIPVSVYFLFTNVFRMVLPSGTLWL
jgi:hypothetical protein